MRIALFRDQDPAMAIDKANLFLKELEKVDGYVRSVDHVSHDGKYIVSVFYEEQLTIRVGVESIVDHLGSLFNTVEKVLKSSG